MANNLNERKMNSFLIDLKEEKRIFDLVKNGMTITDANSTIIYVNPAFTTITGYNKSEAIGNNPGMLHSGYHGKDFYEQMWADITNKGAWEGEIWNRRKSGQIYPAYLTISKIHFANSDQLFYLAIFSDITFLKSDIKNKYHLAFYDPLTELPNRNLFRERVNKISDNKFDEKTALLFMDLNKFKYVNDTFGHCVGDKLLKLVGRRFATITRKDDTIARVGGDEFVAIVTINEDSWLENYANRIVYAVEQPFVIDGNKINVSISIGISIYPKDTDNVDQLIEYADKAMYYAKKHDLPFQYYGDIELDTP
ncbi:GGDEF domain-containing protein [Fluoribacter gormanii]|uniref:Cyclic di-GMP phosphodiesterase Gmr n=1 Tax=Fluoribacter gormanii TaxID=464 RepID=A0A377GKI8_9GAMM|nr:GGDEF domain-containing protein [Fluoribacter gormanii]KTD05356.1 sensory box (GGDEF/EAL domain) regulatory protein [Fluoribacter gormanii]MCW8443057.1 diguanylate cyclase [Fluoribacter gormanii]SIR62959.1 PAS domain S-box-containing protein/diguanylate cyclase (GGDEF) domain-containing protein [Fluoribacter gormanii]STO25340.1 Cyclic di-GMP phosphodiesterase Gmr [Fluoribacter gormanii]